METKQKRGGLKRNSSIWGDLNLSAIAAEIKTQSEASGTPNREPVNSNVTPTAVEDWQKSLKEHHMADPTEADPVQTPNEAPVTAEVPDAKTKVSRKKSTKAQPKRSTRKAAAPSAPTATQSSSASRATRKTYSEKERAQKLTQIEKSVADGDTIKTAAKQAGISEQTYYHWKKAAAPASESGDLKDLLALEDENKRLKALLAGRLRKENAELKRKLGLD
ncbi:MAG: transposase [Nitrococcus sp.]|nr:transposase [Nitrococcus sp.]